MTHLKLPEIVQRLFTITFPPAFFLTLALTGPVQACPADADLLKHMDVPKLMAASFDHYSEVIDDWQAHEQSAGMPALALIQTLKADLYGSPCAENLIRRELIKMLTETAHTGPGQDGEKADVMGLSYQNPPQRAEASQKIFKINIHNNESYQNFYDYVYRWNRKAFELVSTDVFHL